MFTIFRESTYPICRRIPLSSAGSATPSILLRLLVCRVVCLQLSSLLFSSIDRFGSRFWLQRLGAWSCDLWPAQPGAADTNKWIIIIPLLLGNMQPPWRGIADTVQVLNCAKYNWTLQEEEMEGVFCRLSHWQNVNRRGECSYARPDTGSFKHICNVAIIKWRQHEICNIHAKSCAATSSMLLCISHHPLWSTRGIAGGLKINLQFPVSNSSEVILGTVFAGNCPECGTRTPASREC